MSHSAAAALPVKWKSAVYGQASSAWEAISVWTLGLWFGSAKPSAGSDGDDAGAPTWSAWWPISRSSPAAWW